MSISQGNKFDLYQNGKLIRLTYTFFQNGFNCCEIFAQPVSGPWWKRLFNLKFEGIVKMDRSLTYEHLSVFMLMVNRDWLLNHASKFSLAS